MQIINIHITLLNKMSFVNAYFKFKSFAQKKYFL